MSGFSQTPRLMRRLQAEAPGRMKQRYDPGGVIFRPCGALGAAGGASVTGTALPATVIVVLWADAVVLAVAV